MKRTVLILCLITICNISYADIASVGYVDEVVNAKQNALTAGSNITITGNIISATDTDTTYDTGNTTTSGLTKLYTNVGGAIDGTMTQDAIEKELAKKQELLPMATRPASGVYNVVWDGDSGKFIFEQTTEE